MIRNDKEYRHSKNELSELGAELQRLSSVGRSAGREEVASAMVDALRMHIASSAVGRRGKSTHG